MRITRFVTTQEGGSRFVELEIPFPTPFTDEFGNVYRLSDAMGCTAVIADLPAGLDQDWHVAPNRQLVIVMTGSLEVETTDGAVRRFAQGDLFMADDRHGKGHRTRIGAAEPARLMFLKLPDDFDADRWMAS